MKNKGTSKKKKKNMADLLFADFGVHEDRDSLNQPLT